MISDELVLPFHEILDWTLFSLRMRRGALASLPKTLQSMSEARYN
jgi:hypothetical protein